MDESVLLQLTSAASSAHYAVLAGVILMIIVQVCRAFLGDYLPAKLVPAFTLGFAMIGETALLLTTGTTPVWSALVQGLVAGTSAMGFYSLLGKHLLPWGSRSKKKTN